MARNIFEFIYNVASRWSFFSRYRYVAQHCLSSVMLPTNVNGSRHRCCCMDRDVYAAQRWWPGGKSKCCMARFWPNKFHTTHKINEWKRQNNSKNNNQANAKELICAGKRENKRGTRSKQETAKKQPKADKQAQVECRQKKDGEHLSAHGSAFANVHMHVCVCSCI